MDARRIGWAVLRTVVMTLAFIVFTLLVMLRGIIKGLTKLYLIVFAFFIAISFFLPTGMPLAGWVWLSVFAFTAALISYKYDTLLQWLEPEGRTLFFDV